MKPEDSLAAFKAYAASRGTNLQTESLTDVMETVLQFYADCRATDLVSEPEDGDMLLFEYGCYDFGEGDSFHFGVTRQFISALAEDDDAISQLQVTFRYTPDAELRSLKRFNQWCHRQLDLADFRKTIFSSPAFTLVNNRPPIATDLLWDQV